MKIVHVSYAIVNQHDDPQRWLSAIDFFTGIVTCMAQTHEVASVHCIGYEGIVEHEGGRYHFLKAGRWPRLFVFEVNRYVRKLQPDVVIIHGLHFSWQFLCLRFLLGGKVRFFAQHHAERPVRYHKRFLQRWADRFIAGYFFSSAGLGKMWIDTDLIKDPSKIHEVMEVSSVFRLADQIEAKASCRIMGDPVYLWVGRLDTNKDPETLLKAFINFASHYPSATLYLIFSNATLLKTVKKLASKMPHRIRLVGKVAHSEMEQWYNAADFIISTSHYEGSGVAVCEAMSCGCIPVLTDIPAFRMMTGDGASCGVLFPRGDAAMLTRALEKSVVLDRNIEKNKVLHRFTTQLSFAAIADRINRVISACS